MAITERIAVYVDAKVDGFVRDIKKAGTAAKTSLDDKPVGKFQNALGGLGISAGVAKVALAGAVVAAGGFAATKLVGFAKDSVDAFTGLASKVKEFQRASGASAETSSKFVFALDAIGVGSDKGAKGIFQLSQRIGRGKVDLEKYGVEVAKTANGTTDLTGTLLNISDAYIKMKDPAQRAALVMDSFGKSGKDLVPVLARGRQGLKELFDQADRSGNILSQEDLERAKQLSLATNELEQTFEGIKVKAGNALTPFLTDLTKVATELVQVGDGIGAFDLLGFAIQAGLGPLKSMVDTLKAGTDLLGITSNKTSDYAKAQTFLADAEGRYADLVSEGNQNSAEGLKLKKDIGAVNKFVGKTQDELGNALQSTADKARAAESALNSLKTTLFGFGDAQRGVIQSQLQYQAAQDSSADAVDRYNEAVAAGQQSNESEEQFQRRIAGLSRDVQQGYLDIASAHERVGQAALNALTSQKAFDAAAADPGARRKLIADLEDARLKFGDATGAIGQTITRLQNYDATNPAPKKLNVDTGDAIAKVGQLIDFVNALHDKSIKIAVDTFFGTTIGPKNLDGSPDRNNNPFDSKATGGPVTAGKIYRINENGQELFMPSTGGRILNARDSAARLAGQGNGGSAAPIIHLNFYGPTPNPAAVGREYVNAIKAYERGSGSSWRND